MPDEPTTPPASEPASGDPGSAPGTDPATPPAADTFAQEREALQARLRQEQSRADRVTAELEKLKTSSTPTPPAPEPAKDGLSAEQVMALLRRDRELANAVSTLKDEFKMADPTIFDRSHEYESVEAFRAAVESSEQSFKARMEQLQLVPKSDLDALRQRYAERFGDLGDETPPAGENTPPNTGVPTIEELRSWPMSKWDAYEREHPGVIDRVISQAQGGSQ